MTITYKKMETSYQIATFGGGCFWCTEVIFSTLNGVSNVKPGYMGGYLQNPTYKDICEGTTGHAEVIQIHYDEKVISYEDLLMIFFKTHDPTTLNRQGNDVGTQYRSVIFYHNDKQKQAAENIITKLSEQNIFDSKIITELTKEETFYVAEKYHHSYFVNNRMQPYCIAVIQPKLEKFAANFRNKIKPELL